MENRRELTEEERKQTRSTMQKNAVTIRGGVIQRFTMMEPLINQIIRHKLFSNESEYDFYIPLLHKEELSMKVQKKCLIHCIEKREKETGKDWSYLRERIHDIYEKRNMFAHWQLDLGKKGVDRFVDDGIMRFVQTNNYKVLDEYLFDKTKSEDMYERINKVSTELAEIFESIIPPTHHL